MNEFEWIVKYISPITYVGKTESIAKRSIVVEKDYGKNPESIIVVFLGDGINQISVSQVKIWESIIVSYCLKARTYNNSYYQNINGITIKHTTQESFSNEDEEDF